MHRLPLLVLLLSLLLRPVAAASPIMEYTLSTSSLESFYDTEEMWCTLCGPICSCIPVFHDAPYVAASMLSQGFDYLPTVTPQPQFQPESSELGPFFEYIPYPDSSEVPQPLIDKLVQSLQDDATTISQDTVQVHIEETYNVGDRQTANPRRTNRRQDRRTGGYPCDVDGCERTFDRACERTRHKKTHLGSSERPHKCPSCNEGFLYPKDLQRHQRKHIDQPSAQVSYFCRYPGCAKLDGFSRRDNLLRHQRKQHAGMVAAA